MRPLHDRMPVILDRENFDLWLDPKVEDAETLQPLLVPHAVEGFQAFPVSRAVNSPANDSRGLHRAAGGGLVPGADRPGMSIRLESLAYSSRTADTPRRGGSMCQQPKDVLDGKAGPGASDHEPSRP